VTRAHGAAVACQAASILLQYPDGEVRRRLPVVAAAVATLPPGPVRAALDTFLGQFAGTPARELAEHYVATFDRRRKCCLYLTWWTDGETRRRGQSLAELKQRYRAAGLELGGADPGGAGGAGPGGAGPGSAGPGSAGPGSADPGSADPGSADPGSADPGSAGPGSAGPGSAGPGGAGPGGAGPGGTELPDYLPVVLEYAATGDLADGLALLQEHRAGVELLRLALHDVGSPYASVVEAVCALLPGPSPEDEAAARRLARTGPPQESVGLEPYAAAPPGGAGGERR
jgi:nitrate reductase assembly molybdenum cofactor insertion protein NarJ